MIVQYLVDILKADAAVAAIVLDEVYPNSLPDAPSYPCIVVSKVSGVPNYTNAGRTTPEQSRCQLDIYALQYADLIALKVAAIAAVDIRPQPTPVSGNDCTVDQVRCINDFDSPAAAVVAATESAGPRVRRRIVELMTWYR